MFKDAATSQQAPFEHPGADPTPHESSWGRARSRIPIAPGHLSAATTSLPSHRLHQVLRGATGHHFKHQVGGKSHPLLSAGRVRWMRRAAFGAAREGRPQSRIYLISFPPYFTNLKIGAKTAHSEPSYCDWKINHVETLLILIKL